MSPRSMNQILEEMLLWLDEIEIERRLAALRQWGAADWEALRQLAFMHGIAACLHFKLSSTPEYNALYACFPDELRAYLAGEYHMTGLRAKRLQADLSRILAAASQAGLAVMPLKGCLLANRDYPEAALRPMADLDLLVSGADLPRMGQVMLDLGYQPVPKKESAVYHDSFLPPDTRLVRLDGDHPDNPRRVEIHSESQRTIWGLTPAPDLTVGMWRSARPIQLVGQPACAAGETYMLAFLAVHNLAHLMAGNGRLISWLDMTLLADHTPAMFDLPELNFIYPAVRLAARAFPGAFAGIDWAPARSRVHPRILAWSERVALDRRCGLLVDPRHFSHTRILWQRWRPSPFRLALSAGKTPLLPAALHYAGQVMGYGWRKWKTP